MTPLLAIGIGPTEILLILLAAVLLFGASRIPQVGEALGKGIRNFKKSVSGDEIDVTPKQEQIDEGSSEKPKTEEAAQKEPAKS